MIPQTEEHLQDNRFQKLANKIDSDSVEVAPLPILPTSKFSYAPVFFHVMNWFWHLPGLAKLLAVVLGFLLGLVILQAAVKLIASVISMALLAGLVYLGYNFFVAGNSYQIKE